MSAEGTVRRYVTDDFDYVLPEELIAQHPPAERGASRLLAVRRGAFDGGNAEPSGRRATDRALADLEFPTIVDLIPAGDLLVVNTTKVRRARLLGTRPSGQPAEVLLIHPAADPAHWIAMGKPGSALRPGKRITLGDGHFVETVAVHDDGFREVRFVGCTADEAMARYGHIPLPPYIERGDEPADADRYQTVYAEREGSVAAPTAGLHFTEPVLEALALKGVELGRLELEVGPGTFKPVEVDDPSSHPMHEERFDVPERLAEQVRELRARGGRLWAVGTTVVRALESVALDDGTVRAGPGSTALFINPGFRFRAVDALLTNFHLPRSTLVMLVAAFAGYETTMAAYRHAVTERYRFYSYGDAMVIR